MIAKTLGIKGKVIHKQTREVIHNVYKFMKDEARNGTKIPLANYRERVLAATGISKCTYSKITSKEFINGVLVEAFIPSKRIRKGYFCIHIYLYYKPPQPTFLTYVFI